MKRESTQVDVELINGDDLALARQNVIDAHDVKRMDVVMMVNARYQMLAINEKIQQQLQLPVVEKRKAILANGRIVECDVVAPVETIVKGMKNTSSAIVLPDDTMPSISAVYLEDRPVKLPIKLYP